MDVENDVGDNVSDGDDDDVTMVDDDELGGRMLPGNCERSEGSARWLASSSLSSWGIKMSVCPAGEVGERELVERESGRRESEEREERESGEREEGDIA